MRIMRLDEMTGFFVRRLGRTIKGVSGGYLQVDAVIVVQPIGDFLYITASKDGITSKDSSLS
jgi:hypothetical protein